MKPIPDIVLFDLDGTLTDSQVGITEAARFALRRLGREVPGPEEMVKMIGPPLRQSFREIFGLPEPEVEKAFQFYREYYTRTGIHQNALYPGVMDLLNALGRSGVALAIVTGKLTGGAEQVARQFNIRRHFALVVGTELDGTRFDKGVAIQYALDQLDPDRKKTAVMVGDRHMDIEGARRNGIDGIGVLWGYGGRVELEEAGAVWLAPNPEELGRYLLGEATATP